MVFAALAVFSCKKEKEDNTPPAVSARLLGTWRTSFGAADQNKNQVLDASERVAIPADSVVFTFNERGTGTMAIARTSEIPLTWSLLDNDQRLSIRFPGTSVSIEMDSIHTLTSTDLILESRADSIYRWNGFRR